MYGRIFENGKNIIFVRNEKSLAINFVSTNERRMMNYDINKKRYIHDVNCVAVLTEIRREILMIFASICNCIYINIVSRFDVVSMQNYYKNNLYFATIFAAIYNTICNGICIKNYIKTSNNLCLKRPLNNCK